MSIVLDVVQNIVLHGAYELTCSAAVQVFKRCQGLEARHIGKCKTPDKEGDQQYQTDAGTINIALPDPHKEIDQLNLEVNPADNKEVEVIRPVSLLNVPLRNSGPIYPPKTSCMRLTRNSYFS